MNGLGDWRALWEALNLPSDPELQAELRRQYAAPHRVYHTLHHLAECLTLLEETRHLATAPAEIAVALWFHDAIHDPRRHDNEQRSAEWARRALRSAGAEAALCARVTQLIRLTQHDRPPQSPDEALMLDIDLAILGAGPARFDEYERQIRQEYRHVPLPIYRALRRRLLLDFLSRPRLYHTSWFQERREAAARENLQRALLRMSGPGDNSG